MSDQTPMPENPTPEQTPDNQTPDPQDAAKPTEEWATGDEPATGPQLSYLSTLAREAGREVPEGLTKAHASELIDELQGASPRVDPL